MQPDETSEQSLPSTYAVREPRLPRPPFWMVGTMLIFVVTSWIPLALFAKARASTSPDPRVQLAQDMGTQPKYREQQSSPVFADGRADRPRFAGAVARGQLFDDDHYYRGFSTGPDGKVTFFEGFPQRVKVDEALLRRGQQRFNIYCSVCHGLDASGHGPVNERATELAGAMGTNWIPAADLHKDTIRARPDGHIYNTINVGIRNMPGYGAQVPPEDRWAIVSYVRALQLSQNAPAGAVPQEKLGTLK